MPDHVGRADSAGRIRKAMIACLNTDGVRMPDLGGNDSWPSSINTAGTQSRMLRD
jgi:hypothetical protein